MSFVSRKFLLLLGLIAILSVELPSTSYAYKIRSTWYKGQRYLYLKDVANYFGLSLKRYKSYCTLKNNRNSIRLNYHSKLMTVNGVKVYASLPVEVVKMGKSWPALISNIDVKYLIDPILKINNLQKEKVRTIIIDPGHGGKDNGAEGRISKEKTIVLSISRKLAEMLNKAGFNVVMTRNRDVFLSLSERPMVSNRFGGDIFISIHCNSVGSGTATGIETFIYSPQGTESTHGSGKSTPQPGNIFNKNNARLGYEIQKYLSSLSSPDRGLKHAKFKVLRISNIPSVLVETGFLSNAAEEKLLNSPKYQDQLAYKIAQGIISYAKAVK